MSQKQNSLLGFTLVELIVVITIVGILSTVGFVSYSGYLTGARDSNRISQLTKLSDSLQVYAATKSLPLPDDAIDITASGSSNVIAYQGEVGVDVLETIDYTNGGTDPKDDSYYTYYLTKDRKSLQLMALMEEESSVAGITSNATHANYEERYPKVYGKKLGVLTYSDDSNPELLNTPANLIAANITSGELDVVNETGVFTAHVSNTEKVEGTGAILSVFKNVSDFGNNKSIIDIAQNFENYSFTGGNIILSSQGTWNYSAEDTVCTIIELFSEEQVSVIQKLFNQDYTDISIDTDINLSYRGDDSAPKHYVYGKKIKDFSNYNLHLDFNAGNNTTLNFLGDDVSKITCVGTRCGSSGLPSTDSESILLYRLEFNPRCAGATALADDWSRNRYFFAGTYYTVTLSK